MYWKIRGRKKVDDAFNPDKTEVVDDPTPDPPEPKKDPPVATPVPAPDMGALADFLQDKVGTILDE